MEDYFKLRYLPQFGTVKVHVNEHDGTITVEYEKGRPEENGIREDIRIMKYPTCNCGKMLEKCTTDIIRDIRIYKCPKCNEKMEVSYKKDYSKYKDR